LYCIDPAAPSLLSICLPSAEFALFATVFSHVARALRFCCCRRQATVCITYYTIYSAHSDPRFEQRHVFSASPASLDSVTPTTRGLGDESAAAGGGVGDLFYAVASSAASSAAASSAAPGVGASGVDLGLDEVAASLRDFLGGIEALTSAASAGAAAGPAALVPSVPPGFAAPAAASAPNPWDIGAAAAQATAGASVAGGGGGDGAWCVAMAAEHGVVPGASWGGLTPHDQGEWTGKGCDGLLAAAQAAAQARDTVEFLQVPGLEGAAVAGGAGSVLRSQGGIGGEGAGSWWNRGSAAARQRASPGLASSTPPPLSAATVRAAGHGGSGGGGGGGGGGGSPAAPVDPAEAWCREAMWKHDVRPGSSWGKLGPAGQEQWRSRGCDESVSAKAAFIDHGKLPTCPAR